MLKLEGLAPATWIRKVTHSLHESSPGKYSLHEVKQKPYPGRARVHSHPQTQPPVAVISYYATLAQPRCNLGAPTPPAALGLVMFIRPLMYWK